MNIGDFVFTPRFCRVQIKEIFESRDIARENGYVESTHYRKEGYEILGKSVGVNRMVFAAVKYNKGEN